MSARARALRRPAETVSSRPRVAVSYARDSAFHPRWYSERIARHARAAVAGLESAGAFAVVLNSASGAVFKPEDYDGVMIMGGGDVDPGRYGGNRSAPDLHCIDPVADEAEISLVAGAAAAGTPVLGICRGLHVINVAFGGSLIEDLGPESGHKIHRQDPPMASHTVRAVPGTLVAAALGLDEVTVASGHHQAVRRCGGGLRVTACAPDGVVEALESAAPQENWLLAMQWHPEGESAPAGQLAALLRPFIEAARIHLRSR